MDMDGNGTGKEGGSGALENHSIRLPSAFFLVT
jgi:hypothetical protein